MAVQATLNELPCSFHHHTLTTEFSRACHEAAPRCGRSQPLLPPAPPLPTPSPWSDALVQAATLTLTIATHVMCLCCLPLSLVARLLVPSGPCTVNKGALPPLHLEGVSLQFITQSLVLCIWLQLLLGTGGAEHHNYITLRERVRERLYKAIT